MITHFNLSKILKINDTPIPQAKFATHVQPIFLLHFFILFIFAVNTRQSMKRIIYIIFCISIISCGQHNAELENALKLAGENRCELEKVLYHYSQNPSDSLKLQAATFLIENMPGHYTLEGPLINACRKKIDADTTASYFAKKTLDISLSHMDQFRHTANKKEDVQNIKAEFLIRHIDRSFENLNLYPWLEDIPFDLFLEYILPYRFANERLDLWIDSLHFSPKVLQELLFKDDTRYTVTKLEYDIKFSETATHFQSHFIQELLHQNIYRDCQHISTQKNFKSRASCLPVAIDFIPHYANRNGYHYWNKIISPESKNSEISGAFERRTAKVYRKTYSRHPSIRTKTTEYIPELFKNPFLLDVSYEYLQTTNVSINIPKYLKNSSDYAYLCVFNNLRWTPIAIGHIAYPLVKFNDMGKNIVYMPAYYHDKKLTPFNYPFILSLKGEVKHLVPDTNNRQKLILTRKYPSNENLYSYITTLTNLMLEASDQSSFQHPDTILRSVSQKTTYCEEKINTNKKYRYWRISHPHVLSLAELYFFDHQGELIKGEADSVFQAIFDGDPLTNIYQRKKSFIVDFSKPVNLSKIICLPRSDGNGIYPNNEYELFYHDLKGWKSLGRKTASEFQIEYDNVPQGALYWLHNHTTGIEERIFTVSNGIIRFW